MIRTSRTHPHLLLPDSAGAMTEVTLLAWRTIGRNVNLGAALSELLRGLESVIPLRGIGVELDDGWEASAGTLEGGSISRAALPLPERGTVSVAHRSMEGQGAALAEALSEPIAVGVANARRAREAERDRVAATAERRAHLARLNRQDAAGSIIGADDGLRGVTRRVEQVAMTDAPVLLLGETGTGKEVIARALHARSARAAGPFIRVNCGAIPPELVDSELFGHERGGFTGASATRAGWFERADGGTLFLDEIGDLPAAAQVRLLRVLQDGSYQRVGGAGRAHHGRPDPGGDPS